MAFEFTQVVAQLVDAVASVGELEGAEDSLMDLPGGRATDVAATVQEDFEPADDTRILVRWTCDKFKRLRQKPRDRCRIRGRIRCMRGL